MNYPSPLTVIPLILHGANIAKTIENSYANFTDYLTKTTSAFRFMAIGATKVVGLPRSSNPQIAVAVIAEFLTKIFNTATK